MPSPDSPYYDELSRAAAKELERYLSDFGRYSSHYFSIVAAGDGARDLEQARTRVEKFYEMWNHLAGVCREFQRRKDLAVMLP